MRVTASATKLDFQTAQHPLCMQIVGPANRPFALVRDEHKTALFRLPSGEKVWNSDFGVRNCSAWPTKSSFVSVHGQRSAWSDAGGRLLLLAGVTTQGYSLRAIELLTGKQLWKRAFRGPPSKRKQPGMSSGFFSATPRVSIAGGFKVPVMVYVTDHLGLVSQRGHFTEFLAIEPNTGKTLWLQSVNGGTAMVGEFDTNRFRDARRAFRLENSGKLTELAKFAEEQDDILVVKDRVFAVRHLTGTSVRVSLADAKTHEVLLHRDIALPKVKRARLIHLDGSTFLLVNENRLVLLSKRLEARWEASVKPYLYGLRTLPGNRILALAAGSGGYFYVLDRRSGKQLLEVKAPARSCGVNEAFSIALPGQVVLPFGKHLSLLDSKTLHHEVLQNVPGLLNCAVRGSHLIGETHRLFVKDPGSSVFAVSFRRA